MNMTFVILIIIGAAALWFFKDRLSVSGAKTPTGGGGGTPGSLPDEAPGHDPTKDEADWKAVNGVVADWAGHGPGSMQFDYQNLVSADSRECGNYNFKQPPPPDYIDQLSMFSTGLREGKFYSTAIFNRLVGVWSSYRNAWEYHLRSLDHDRAPCRVLIRNHWNTCNTTQQKSNGLEQIFVDFYTTHPLAKQITAAKFFGD